MITAFTDGDIAPIEGTQLSVIATRHRYRVTHMQ